MLLCAADGNLIMKRQLLLKLLYHSKEVVRRKVPQSTKSFISIMPCHIVNNLFQLRTGHGTLKSIPNEMHQQATLLFRVWPTGNN